MQFDWRAISGPALTIATTVIAVAVDRHFVTVPSPAPLFICIVAFAASFSGLASGMASAAVAVGGAALFFLNHHATPGYEATDLARLLLLALTAAGTAAITGLLRKRLMDAFALERRHYATAARCRPRWIRSTSASCCSIPTPARNSSTAPSAIISRFRTGRPTASRPSSR